MWRLSWIVGALCLLIAGCGDDGVVPSGPETRSLMLQVSVPSLANPEEIVNQPIASEVGLFSRDLSGKVGTVLNNMPAAYNGYKWYLKGVESVQLGSDSLTVYGYYPYDATWAENQELMVYSGTTDYLYGQHDLMRYGYIHVGQPLVHLRMNHALACLTFDLRPILEQRRSVTKVQLRGDMLVDRPVGRAYLNIVTGELSPIASLTTTLTAVMNKDKTMATLFIIPSKHTDIWIGLEINGKTMWVSKEDFDMSSGKLYDFLLDYDVKAEDLVIREMKIEDWNQGPEVDLGNQQV